MSAEPGADEAPLTSDEDIERIFIGPVTPHDWIVLVERGPQWPKRFPDAAIDLHVFSAGAHGAGRSRTAGPARALVDPAVAVS